MKALITGITGQDGYYLSKLLLKKGYEVYGIIRRKSKVEPLPFEDEISYLYGDMCDATSLRSLIDIVKPDEIYNLAAQSHVGISFKMPEYTCNVNAMGVVRILDKIKDMNIKFYQASTSEMFGFWNNTANESTPFSVKSPYGASKLFAHYICNIYRKAYNMFNCCGILFNHESPRRGENFVTRKIVKGIYNIAHGLQDTLYLGNLDSQRDWGFAGDYVEAMWLMLQQDEPDDYVVATGKTHSVRDFVEEACKCMKISITWNGKKGVDEVGIIEDKCDRIYLGTVKVSPEFYRPLDVTYLKGDSSKSRRILGWKPTVDFKKLVKLMINEEGK